MSRWLPSKDGHQTPFHFLIVSWLVSCPESLAWEKGEGHEKKSHWKT